MGPNSQPSRSTPRLSSIHPKSSKRCQTGASTRRRNQIGANDVSRRVSIVAEVQVTNGEPNASRGRILNARDAVEYLGISLSTLNRIEKQGLLVPFRTPGGHRRYAQKMLDEYLESSRRLPDDDGVGEIE
ncbi:MAG TPA: helix-turn-helix domain-containing protein [Anaerolineales bacterium]|nr:helix-turn-helix domain-containing protein [Anaerolineales bacterium]